MPADVALLRTWRNALTPRPLEAQGDMAGARDAFEESLGLARRIDERWGPTPESLRDVSTAQAKVDRLRAGPGTVDS